MFAALFLPARDIFTHGLTLEWRPSAELAGLLFLVALAVFARPQLAARRGAALALALLVIATALFNLADAAAPTLLGRDLNLYWDLRHLPSIFGLARASAGLWSASAAVGLGCSALLLGVGGTYWVWRRVLVALADKRIAMAIAVLLGLSLGVTAFLPGERRPLAIGLGNGILRNAAGLENAWGAAFGSDARPAAALAAPAPPRGDLAGLKRQDVYVIYIESYGATVYDTPEFRAAMQQPLAKFEAVLHAAGYSIASGRLISPTFGGGSWLAHATLASGVRLDDPVLYSQLLGSGRKLMPAYFREAGWRTVDIMPGTKQPSAEVARAWGFDREVYAADLRYHGPSFGWFTIPDQFTLSRANTIRAALGPNTPVFMQIVLISSHFPFSPVPPYLADWRDCGTFASVPAAAWEEIRRPPGWTNLAPNYLQSLKYDFAVLGDWLADRLSGNALVILLGDHQPPAVIGGAAREWTVPIHALSRDPELVARFISAGYVDGLIPPQSAPPQGMETFLPTFLAAFHRSG